ncbi:MAG: hypothetical protein CVU60_00305 [Deltaproteobacteria bacterium HGW-Deltaproteobacteria-18]|jgi:AcrR family transcriptional regulator|nr:MAG: hypothetical protein CVU60_00305 [Deltaproteobacteria bacterium HGW-Deltaproteobacteria-18]
MTLQRVAERLLTAARGVIEGCGPCCGQDGRDSAADVQTRHRLLLAAREVFGRKGRAVTVREICLAARANGAAVNYHFGGKEELLAEVLRILLDELLAIYPMNGGVADDAPAAERLHGFVFAFLCRILLPAGREDECMLGQMLSEAFVRPMPPFEVHARRHRADVRNYLAPLLLDLALEGGMVADGRDDMRIQMMGRSIVAQILFYNTNRDALMAQRDGLPFTPDEVSEAALHITRFSLGGITHISEHMK